MNKKWYNPKAEANDGVAFDTSARSGQSGLSTVVAKPSLEKAWAYFEHFALNRCIIDDSGAADSKDSKKAEPGENTMATRLYSPIRLAHAQLGDFGIGIGLYFSTLRLILFLTIVSGFINSINIQFFASSSYQSPSDRDSIFPALVRGSAVCTDTDWVACPSCECASDDRVTAQTLRRQDVLPLDRCQVREVDGSLRTYVLKNECGDIPIYVGMVNYGTLILFFLVTYVYFGIFLRQQETRFDEDEQTAQDYSIQVENPRKCWQEYLIVVLRSCSVLLIACALFVQPILLRIQMNGTDSSRKTLVPTRRFARVRWRMIFCSIHWWSGENVCEI